MSESKKTTDRKAIRRWTEERNGVPAFVKGTESGADGVLRIHFPENSDSEDSFDEVDWEQFFDSFEKNNLAFLYQEEKQDGEKSTFHKFVSR